MAYYYLVASLPVIGLDQELPMTPEDLADQLVRHLPEGPSRDLLTLLEGADRPVEDGAAQNWVRQETQFRNALVRARASRLGVRAEPFLREHEGFDTYTDQAAQTVMGLGSPLERERAADRWRWEAVQEIDNADPFGMGALVAYVVRLRIAARWRGLDAERGAKAAAALVETNVAGVR